jgi:hypothetical protein
MAFGLNAIRIHRVTRETNGTSLRATLLAIPVETIGQIQPASIPTFITAVASIVTWIARLSLATATCGMNEE